MLFCGDMSVPNSECGKLLIKSLRAIPFFKGQTTIINLEGAIVNPLPSDCFWKIYNDISVLDIINVTGRLIFSLANNHIYDFPDYIASTKACLDRSGILYFGLNEHNRIHPLEFSSKGRKYVIFGHCWDLYTKTNPNKLTSDVVCSNSYQEFYNSVVQYVSRNTGCRVICFMHWNFDFEHYPFPSYVQLCHDLIDAGVWTIIGNHAHCMQPFEVYQGHFIAYGLGNFYMPDNYFFNGKLKYPEESHNMYIVEMDEDDLDIVMIHYFRTNTEESKLLETKVLNLSKCTESINIVQYKKCFRQLRSKNFLVPIFYDYRDSIENKLKLLFLIGKVRLIRFVKTTLDRIK